VSPSPRKPQLPARGDTAIARSYDAIAERYAEQFADELQSKPLDRAMLDELATRSRGRGPVADVGCGPGQAAGHLAARGARRDRRRHLAEDARDRARRVSGGRVS
jgi:SAM-dependent methyltransferase